MQALTCERSARACASRSWQFANRCFDFVALGCQQLRRCESRSCRALCRCEPGSVPGGGPIRAARSIANFSSIDSGPGETRLVRRGADATVFGLTDSGVGSAPFGAVYRRGLESSTARGRAAAKSAVRARGAHLGLPKAALWRQGAEGVPRSRVERPCLRRVRIGSAKIFLLEAEPGKSLK